MSENHSVGTQMQPNQSRTELKNFSTLCFHPPAIAMPSAVLCFYDHTMQYNDFLLCSKSFCKLLRKKPPTKQQVENAENKRPEVCIVLTKPVGLKYQGWVVAVVISYLLVHIGNAS